MSGFSDSNLQIAISEKPQSNYVTPTVPAASPDQTYIEQVITAKNFIKKTVPKSNNKGHSTGQRMATESDIEGGHSTTFSMPFVPSFQNIGRYLLAIMGSSASSEVDELFRNLFSLLDPKVSSQLPAYTLIEHAAPANNGLNVKAPGMCGKSLTLSGNGAAKISGSMEWIGSGEYIQPSGVTWATHVKPTQGTQVPIYNTTSSLVRSDAPGGGNAVTKSLCENLGWEIGITNTFDEADYGCVRLANPDDVSKGVYRSHLPLIDTEIRSNWKFKLPANSVEMTLLENNAPLKLLFALLSTQTLTDESHVLRFDMPLNKYAVVDHTSENGFIYVTIEPETLYSTSAGYALQAELINNVESYI